MKNSRGEFGWAGIMCRERITNNICSFSETA